jgi:hypothetical protein
MPALVAFGIDPTHSVRLVLAVPVDRSTRCVAPDATSSNVV